MTTAKVVRKENIVMYGKHQQLHKRGMAEWELVLQACNGSFWSWSHMPDYGASLPHPSPLK